MTPHSPAFADALAAVSALLGPADNEHPLVVDGDGTHPALARWWSGLVSLAVTDGDPPVMTALRPDGDFRAWQSIGDGTVRDAAAWLGWQVPRTTLPGLAPAGDDGCGLVFADPTGDAPATRCAHRRLAPRFDPDAASALSAGAVRRRWPRDWGECPDCGEQVIVYASAEHFVAGDR